MPLVEATKVGYQVADELVLSVIAELVALVEVVAVSALPVNAPIKLVAVTEVSPANVVEVPPKAIFVLPIVTELFVNAPLGIFVKDAPEPLNKVALNVPVDG